ncbi:hypothetical protein [Streptomyces scopuliridis]|uniref:hypothetical protein n=1 Tax=Streptomyces scopuliridis TaxID=452529 RepID=UPI0036D0D2B2
MLTEPNSEFMQVKGPFCYRPGMERVGSSERDLKRVVVPDVVLETGDCWEPCQPQNVNETRIDPMATYCKDLLAASTPASTL